jgi:hypothetical protein
LSEDSDNELSLTLQRRDPAVFDECVQKFSRIAQARLEQRMYRVTTSSSQDLSDLAFHLGDLDAGARDVVEIYGMSLKNKVRDTSRVKAAAYADAGQLIALELMGHLVTYYRNLCRRQS